MVVQQDTAGTEKFQLDTVDSKIELGDDCAIGQNVNSSSQFNETLILKQSLLRVSQQKPRHQESRWSPVEDEFQDDTINDKSRRKIFTKTRSVKHTDGKISDVTRRSLQITAENLLRKYRSFLADNSRPKYKCKISDTCRRRRGELSPNHRKNTNAELAFRKEKVRKLPLIPVVRTSSLNRAPSVYISQVNSNTASYNVKSRSDHVDYCTENQATLNKNIWARSLMHPEVHGAVDGVRECECFQYVHGGSIIFGKSITPLRRIFWIVMLAVFLAIAIAVLVVLSTRFRRYDMVTRMSYKSRDFLQFPSVTMCMFYQNLTKGFAPINSFVTNCRWLNEDKDCSELFQFYKQPIGDTRCFTFNKSMEVRFVGSMNGLMFRLSKGHSTTVKLHQSDEFPFGTDDSAVHMANGKMTDISFTVKQIEDLPQPYSDCLPTTSVQNKLKYFKVYSYSRCLAECETAVTMGVCNCKLPYYPGNGNVCVTSHLQKCAFNAIANLDRKKLCDCPKKCLRTIYEPSVKSYAMDGISRNSGLAKIYTEDVTVKEIQNIPYYDGYNIFCDICALFVCLVGVSACSFIQLLEKIVTTLLKLCSSRIDRISNVDI